MAKTRSERDFETTYKDRADLRNDAPRQERRGHEELEPQNRPHSPERRVAKAAVSRRPLAAGASKMISRYQPGDSSRCM